MIAVSRPRRIVLTTLSTLCIAMAAGTGASAATDTTVPRLIRRPPPAVVKPPYPITIAHKYGETTVEEFPERIAVVGLLEQDALIGLGVVPVATTEWFGEHAGAVWPWAADELEALGAEPPVVLGGSAEINFESVAAQSPDLILALYSGLTEQDYELLSDIAPTVAQPSEYIDYGIPWDELTLTVGQIVGKSDEAAALVADVEAQFAAAARPIRSSSAPPR